MKTAHPLFLLALAFVPGCHQDQVQSLRIEKSAPANLPPGHPPLITALPEGPLPRPEKGQALAWTLPKGWTKLPAEGMRYATLKPPTGGNAEVSVVVLSGPAGGELANVNRWRAQLGLPDVAAAALASGRRIVQSQTGPVAVFEFSNAGNSLVVGLLPVASGPTWFLKLMGDDASVLQAKPDFMQLLGTLRLG